MAPLIAGVRRLLPAWPGKAFWALLFAACMLPRAVPAQTAAGKEFRIKALFLFNFTQFTVWPMDSSAADDSIFAIGILGPDPFGNFLDEVVRGELVQGHPLAIKRFAHAKEVSGCSILYIGRVDSSETRMAIAACKSQRILSVGESESIAGTGVMIRFKTRNGRIRLGVDMEPLHAAGLKLSAKLLRLADVVPTASE